MNYSINGYKDNSADKNNSYNIIPGKSITMQGVSRSLTLVPIVNGQPQYDRKRVAKPGDSDIEFEDDVESVLELPYAQYGIGNLLNPRTFQQTMYPVENFNSSLDYSTGVAGNSYMENNMPNFQNPYINQNQVQTNLPSTNEELTPLSLQPKGIIAPDTQTPLDDNLRQQQEALQIKDNVQINNNRNRPFIGSINPYGGWNMENTATALGAFARDKNVLGTVASAGKLLLSGARNYFAGDAAMKTYRESQQEYEDKMQDAERTQGWHWMQKGGKIGKILTGNYITGDENNQNPNVEFERGEYAQLPNGHTMEVLGDRHSEGGELATLPEGSRVISDYLKIGSKLATYFKKEHGLNVKSGSTFSTVLDQYKRKIGLSKLIDEESGLMKKIADQDDVEFEGTRDINLEVLSKKVNEMKPQKEALEDKFNTFTNLVFERQEQSKEVEGNNFEKQQGGDIVDPAMGQTPPQSTDGQDPMPQQPQSEIEQLILAYSQITGQDPATIIQQLQEITDETQLQQVIQQMMQAVQQTELAPEQQQTANPTPVEQEQVEQPDEQNAEQFKKGGVYYAQTGMTPDQFNSFLTNYRWQPDYQYGDINSQKTSLGNVLNRMGIQYGNSDLNTQMSQDAFAGQAQNAFRNKYKATSDHYSSKVAGTQTGLQNALDSKLVTESQLKNLGVKVKDGKVLRGSKGIVPQDNEEKLTNLITKAGAEKPEAFKNYVDNNFVDNKWYFRFPDIKDVNFSDEKQRDEYIKNGDYKLVETVDNKPIYYSNKQGLYFSPNVGTPAKTDPNGTPTPMSDTSGKQGNGMQEFGNRDRNYDNGLPMLVPDQSNIAPNYIPTTLRQIGSVQANPIAISPEATIQELNRQYNTASNMITENNPYTAGSAQANLQAQTNNSINQAYSQAAIANAQDRRNVENINEERIQQRDTTNLGLMGQYEKEAIVGLDNYIQSWRNYIDNRNLQNVNNWNLENQRQAFNAVNDNYKIGSMGWYQTDESPIFYFTGMNGQPMAYNTRTKQTYEVSKKNQDGTKTKSTTETTTNPPRKQKGGLLLSKDIKNWLK